MNSVPHLCFCILSSISGFSCLGISGFFSLDLLEYCDDLITITRRAYNFSSTFGLSGLASQDDLNAGISISIVSLLSSLLRLG